MGTLNTHAVHTFLSQLLLDKLMICFQKFLRHEIGNFPPKIGKKDTFWHWEYNRITAIKSAKNKPWMCITVISLCCENANKWALQVTTPPPAKKTKSEPEKNLGIGSPRGVSPVSFTPNHNNPSLWKFWVKTEWRRVGGVTENVNKRIQITLFFRMIDDFWKIEYSKMSHTS